MQRFVGQKCDSTSQENFFITLESVLTKNVKISQSNEHQNIGAFKRDQMESPASLAQLEFWHLLIKLYQIWKKKIFNPRLTRNSVKTLTDILADEDLRFLGIALNLLRVILILLLIALKIFRIISKLQKSSWLTLTKRTFWVHLRNTSYISIFFLLKLRNGWIQ